MKPFPARIKYTNSPVIVLDFTDEGNPIIVSAIGEVYALSSDSVIEATGWSSDWPVTPEFRDAWDANHKVEQE